MTDATLTKLTGGLLMAMRRQVDHLVGEGLVDWGVEGGHTTSDQLRLTVAARKEAVVQLHVKGLSQRQIAAALNVPKSTVHDDLSETGQHSPEIGQAVEVSEKDILSAAKEIRAEKQSDKNEARAAREQALGSRPQVHRRAD